MKTNLLNVACLVMGSVLAAQTGENASSVSPAPVTFHKRSLFIPPSQPYPLISSFGWSNGYYASLTQPKRLQGALVNQARKSGNTNLPSAQMTTSPSTNYFRVVKAPRWLTNATAVSNATAQASVATPGRPLPPTGLRVISVGQ